MEREAILFDVADNVATITLNRPDNLNSFNKAMAVDMKWAWETVRDTRRHPLRRAPGERRPRLLHRRRHQGRQQLVHEGQRLEQLRPRHTSWRRSSTTGSGSRWSPPCTGSAPAGRSTSSTSPTSSSAPRTPCSSTRTPTSGSSARSSRSACCTGACRLGDVLRWALMGNEERITAETALRLGLVTEVVTREQLRDRAREIALSIARRNPKAIQGTIRAIWESLDMTRTAALHNGFVVHADRQLPPTPAAPRDKSETQYR